MGLGLPLGLGLHGTGNETGAGDGTSWRMHGVGAKGAWNWDWGLRAGARRVDIFVFQMIDLYKDPRGEGVFGQVQDTKHASMAPPPAP